MNTHKILIVLAAAGLWGSSCAWYDGSPSLVPPTVEEDPGLPCLTVSVQGQERLLHWRSFGDESLPVFLVIHGSLSDMRAYQPFKIFQNRFRVVFYDMGGNGLSQRLDRPALAIDRMVEEIHQVHEAVSPGRAMVVLGHSWSADFTALYCARYPGEVRAAILMEPFGLKADFMTQVQGIVNLTRQGYLDMSWASQTLGPSGHEELDFRILGMLTSAVRNFFVDPDHPPAWPVWRVGGLALLVWESEILDGTGSYSYDFTPGLAGFTSPVLLVGSSHSPIGYAFQERNHLGLFPQALSLRIENSGHRMITEQWTALEAGISAFLDQVLAGGTW